eukprot:TRINITY_DN13925_c0_g5_i6.p1 TRINITY_DN13925_c0_g5~~TRINITY_DN13925_c0_g5_i6.p1  ORF type:complete len:211 (-),score=44.50 TRINITY_DN13925_c0_g5_i6:673-1305(-)
MDMNAPDDYVETTQQSLEDTLLFINYVRAKKNHLLQPVVTPRFIPTCSAALLLGLGKIAREEDVHIQSHISESRDEVHFSNSCFPHIGNGRDTAIFEHFGLLTEKCVMAHGVFLTDSEIEVLMDHGTSLSHCPLSNFFFGNAQLNVADILSKNSDFKIGLGTDIAGGYQASMLGAMRNTVITSQVLESLASFPSACLSSQPSLLPETSDF